MSYFIGICDVMLILFCDVNTCLKLLYISSRKGKHKSGKVSEPKNVQTSTKKRSLRPYQGTSPILCSMQQVLLLCRIMMETLVCHLLMLYKEITRHFYRKVTDEQTNQSTVQRGVSLWDEQENTVDLTKLQTWEGVVAAWCAVKRSFSFFYYCP